MRFVSTYLVLLSVFCVPAVAASSDERIPEEQTLASLEQRAAQAPAKSQCYVYAQLVHDMIEYSLRQYAAGNPEKASGMLKRSQELTRVIRARLGGDTKKLKEAQILLRRTAYRLTDLLHAGSYDDGTLLQETLAQLNRTQDDLMLQLFKR